MSAQLSELRTYFQQITHTTDDSNIAGTTYELQLLNKAYEKTAYKYNWPQTLKRFADVIIAYVDRYALQSDFRKFLFIYQQGNLIEDTDAKYILNSYGLYTVFHDSSEYTLSTQPTSASTPFTMSGSYSAGAAVEITLDTVTGLAVGDEIFINDGASSEFTRIQAINSTTLTITCKIRYNHSADVLYRVQDLIYFQYQKTVTALATSTDVPVTPSETHLIIPHYAAYLYYKDIEEPDKAQSHLDIWTNETDEAWLAFGKNSAGAVGQFSL